MTQPTTAKVVSISATIPSGRLSKRDAQKLINELAKNSSNVAYSPHAKEQMVRGFSYPGMLTILREGIIADEPLLVNGKWRYKIIFYKFKGNRDASCVVEIKGSKKLKVITVMWIDL
jgi:hypothetical protein